MCECYACLKNIKFPSDDCHCDTCICDIIFKMDTSICSSCHKLYCSDCNFSIIIHIDDNDYIREMEKFISHSCTERKYDICCSERKKDLEDDDSIECLDNDEYCSECK